MHCLHQIGQSQSMCIRECIVSKKIKVGQEFIVQWKISKWSLPNKVPMSNRAEPIACVTGSKVNIFHLVKFLISSIYILV